MGAEYWVQQRVASCRCEQSSHSNEVICLVKNGKTRLHTCPEHSQHSQERKNPERVHGLEFHFDKDEQAAEEDIWIHPKYSTTTYLNAEIDGFPAGGAPLIVFQTISEEDEEREDENEDEGGELNNNNSNYEGNYIEEREKEEEVDNNDDNDDEVPSLVYIDDSDKLKLHLKSPNRGRYDKEKKEIEKEKEEEEGEEHDDEDDEELNPKTPSSAWIIFPVVNRHIMFPGTFLHGVAGELLLPSLLLTSIQNNDIVNNCRNISNFSIIDQNVSNNNNYNNNDNNNNNNNNTQNNNNNNKKHDINDRKNASKSGDNRNHDDDDNNSTHASHRINGKNSEMSDESHTKLGDNSANKNLPGNTYNYSRLSLLVNVWTTHHPKAVIRLDTMSFNSQLDKVKIEKDDKSIKNDKITKSDFDFKQFFSNLENNEDKKCMSFIPNNKPKIIKKNNVSMDISRQGSLSDHIRSTKLKLKLKFPSMKKVDVEEGIDDGIIKMMGNGMEENKIRVCHVEVISADGKEHDSDYNINRSENNDNDNTKIFSYNNEKHKSNESDKKKSQNAIDCVLNNKKEGTLAFKKNYNDNLYYLQEHRPGDTAPLPLKDLKEEFQKSSNLGLNNGNVIHVKYSYS